MDNDIQLRVNVNIFRMLCAVWLCLTVIMAMPWCTLPPELKQLHGAITGGLLIIFTAFEKKITGESPNDQQPIIPAQTPAQPENQES